MPIQGQAASDRVTLTVPPHSILSSIYPLICIYNSHKNILLIHQAGSSSFTLYYEKRDKEVNFYGRRKTAKEDTASPAASSPCACKAHACARLFPALLIKNCVLCFNVKGMQLLCIHIQVNAVARFYTDRRIYSCRPGCTVHIEVQEGFSSQHLVYADGCMEAGILVCTLNVCLVVQILRTDSQSNLLADVTLLL